MAVSYEVSFFTTFPSQFKQVFPKTMMIPFPTENSRARCFRASSRVNHISLTVGTFINSAFFVDVVAVDAVLIVNN